MLCSVCCLISYRSFLLLCDIRAAFVLVPTYLPTVTAYPNVDGEEKDRTEIDKEDATGGVIPSFRLLETIFLTN